MGKKTDQEKAAKHASKGDKHLERGKPEKALEEYRKALELDPDIPGIFDKLLEVRDHIGGDWNLEDFAETVSWTMEKQAQENPAMKQVHAKLSPEWKKAYEIALRILADPAENLKSEDVEELVGMGEVATRALIGILLDLKHATSPDSEKPKEERLEEEESTESPSNEDIIE